MLENSAAEYLHLSDKVSGYSSYIHYGMGVHRGQILSILITVFSFFLSFLGNLYCPNGVWTFCVNSCSNYFYPCCLTGNFARHCWPRFLEEGAFEELKVIPSIRPLCSILPLPFESFAIDWDPVNILFSGLVLMVPWASFSRLILHQRTVSWFAPLLSMRSYGSEWHSNVWPFLLQIGGNTY